MSVNMALQLDVSEHEELDRLIAKLDKEEMQIVTDYVANLLLSRVILQENKSSVSHNSRR